jgi:hypothetical protein
MTAAGIAVPSGEGDAMRRLGRHYIPARYRTRTRPGRLRLTTVRPMRPRQIADAERILAFVDASWRGLS